MQTQATTEITDKVSAPMPQSTALTYTRVNDEWHILRTPNGVYFGYSKLQVFEKADAHKRQNIIADAIRLNVRPLLVRQRLVSRVAI